MKYRVIRTSLWDNGLPCSGATLEYVNGSFVHTITLNDLDALMAFVRENGKCIIFNSNPNLLPTIEIYDDYRE
jgi:hypothetical protein